MIGIHTGVNIRDNTRAENVKHTLRIRDSYYLCGWLNHVAVPDIGIEIVIWRCIGKAGRRSRKLIQSANQTNYQVRFRIDDAWDVAKQVQKRVQIKRSRHHK